MPGYAPPNLLLFKRLGRAVEVPVELQPDDAPRRKAEALPNLGKSAGDEVVGQDQHAYEEDFLGELVNVAEEVELDLVAALSPKFPARLAGVDEEAGNGTQSRSCRAIQRAVLDHVSKHKIGP